MRHNLASIRREYSLQQLTRDSVHPDPLVQFKKWLSEALEAQVNEPTAMTLATAGSDGKPAARIVLLKDVNEQGLSFYTNYKSRKGRQLEANPFAALVFFWPELERQVRFEGHTVKLPATESDQYFSSRPEDSKTGAWASKQSSIISSREELEKKACQCAEQFAGREIPRPGFWGGYRLLVDSVEFWQGRESRLHDRIRYNKIGSDSNRETTGSSDHIDNTGNNEKSAERKGTEGNNKPDGKESRISSGARESWTIVRLSP